MTSRNRPGQNSLLANCMTQSQKERERKRKRENRDSEEDEQMEGDKAGAERERDEGSEGKGKQNRTNLTHHVALDIPHYCQLSPSESDLYCAEKEKTQYSQLSIKVEFIIQLQEYCWRAREGREISFIHSIQRQPSQYFLIKLFASSS